MKKVGICACYNTLNYGSMLQAYATQVAIERLGCDGEYIIYKKKKTPGFVLKQIPRLLNSNLMFDKMLAYKKKSALKKHPETQKQDALRVQAFMRFQKQYYRHFSPEFYGYEALCEGAKRYDAVVVGSDQLWTPGGLPTNFYILMFVPDEIPKISYATSFGVSKIPWYQRERTKRFLRRIDHLSVRELKGADIVREVAGVEAKVVADPTLLLTGEEWLEKIPAKRVVEEKYIFCYFLGENPEHRTLSRQFAEKKGLPIVTTPFLDSFVEEDQHFGDKALFDIAPDDFVNLIRGAEYIITDSFHGSIFSILNQKKFMTMNRFAEGANSRNSRIDSLCALLGLQQRRCSGSMDAIEEDIPYDAVAEKLTALREESLAYLKQALLPEE